MTNIVVTGGAGFIGSHLVDALVAEGHRVVVLDNLSSGQREFLADSLAHIELREMDLLNDPIAPHFADAELVFHLAANPEVRVGETDSHVHVEQNLTVTHRVLEALREAGVRDLAFTSTSTVYGEATELPTHETYGPLAPISLYGASKLAAEAIIAGYCGTFGLRAVSYRFANCVGPRSNHGVTYDFVHKLRRDPARLEILGDGRQRKSYFHVEDCVSGMLAALPRDACPADGGFAAFNIGSADAIDVVTVADAVCEALVLADVAYAFTGGVQGGRGWVGDVKEMALAIDVLRARGWKPRYGSRDAIAATARWLRDH